MSQYDRPVQFPFVQDDRQSTLRRVSPSAYIQIARGAAVDTTPGSDSSREELEAAIEAIGEILDAIHGGVKA